LYSFCTGGIPSYPQINLNDAWHHVAIVDSESSSALYVDGVLLFSGAGGPPGNCYQGSPFFQIGGGSDNQWVTGDLDDIGFWLRALTADEISGLFNASVQPPCISPANVSIDGLNTSYETTDPPVQLTGNPENGVFFGMGVTGSLFDPYVAGPGMHTIIYTYVDNDGCVASVGLCTEVIQGVGFTDWEMFHTNELSVYPNPTSDQFTLETNLVGMLRISIYDSKGSIVLTKSYPATGMGSPHILDMRGVSPGKYTLLITDGTTQLQQSVVKR
jgi:hypothetical protein